MADDIYKSLRYFLIFGYCAGIVPIYGLNQDDYQRLHFRRNSIASGTSLLIIIVSGINCAGAAFRVVREGRNSIFQLYGVSLPMVYYAVVAFKYLFFLRNAGKLVDLLKMWNSVSMRIPVRDGNLTRGVNLLAGVFVTCFTIKNVILNLKYLGIVGGKEYGSVEANVTSLELYYYRSSRYWAHMIPYHPILSLALFIQNQIFYHGWCFADIFVFVTARSLNFKLLTYLQKLQCFFSQSQQPNHLSRCQSQLVLINWPMVCQDYEMLAELVTAFSNFLSPLIFVCYGVNIFYLSFQIWAMPTWTPNVLPFVYALGSAGIYTASLIVSNIQASRVHSYGMALGKLILHKCPVEFFPSYTDRVERIVEMNEIGLTAFGCFTITNSILLRIIGVIFTLEVLLVQGQVKI